MNTHRNDPTTSVRKMTLVTTMAVVTAVTAVLYATFGGTKSPPTTPTVVKTGAVLVHAVQEHVALVHGVHQVVNSVVEVHVPERVVHNHSDVVPFG